MPGSEKSWTENQNPSRKPEAGFPSNRGRALVEDRVGPTCVFVTEHHGRGSTDAKALGLGDLPEAPERRVGTPLQVSLLCEPRTPRHDRGASPSPVHGGRQASRHWCVLLQARLGFLTTRRTTPGRARPFQSLSRWREPCRGDGTRPGPQGSRRTDLSSLSLHRAPARTRYFWGLAWTRPEARPATRAPGAT